jgi:hypothetical protein
MVVAVGIAGAYFLMSALSLAAVLVLLPIPKSTSQPRPTEPMLASIRDGLAYAKRAGPVRSMLILSLLAEVLGYSHAYMMPVIARDILGLEADGLGYLMAAYGAGGIGYDTTQSTLLQINVPDAVRGRVMGLYTFTLGLAPIGGFQLGIAAGFIGAPLAVEVGGALLTLSVLRMLPLGKQLNG